MSAQGDPEEAAIVAAFLSRYLEDRASRSLVSLADYQAPPLDVAIQEALEDFIARREAVLPDTVA